MELVRAASLTGYVATMWELGVDPAPLLREAGLSPQVLANSEQLISGVAAMRLLERSAAATGCVTLGLRMAEKRSLASLGAISLMVTHASSLRLALAALTEFRNRVNSTLMLQIEEGDGVVVVRENFVFSTPEPLRQGSDLALGVLVRLCADVLGENWAPLAVCFSHEAPPVREMSIFPRLFRCRPEFDSQFDGIVIDARDLDRANSRADSDLASHARKLIEAVRYADLQTTQQRIEQLIVLLLPTGRATIRTCAESLGVTIRTLQRKLDAEGVGFNELLNRVRMQLATQYLANPCVRVTDVADLLGYGSIGAFTRWHTQSFGASPKKLRARYPDRFRPGHSVRAPR
ncbi:MAG: hypothetical protein BGO24_10550 [Sphingomonas sp. 67-36]|nr:AraC family transcriptional regulator [Hyphomicrobiales bacterium]OJV33861.1 MAG: hypothetical protein BGO24_10550 [Sphingomonas sp. 67-36]